MRNHYASWMLSLVSESRRFSLISTDLPVNNSTGAVGLEGTPSVEPFASFSPPQAILSPSSAAKGSRPCDAGIEADTHRMAASVEAASLGALISWLFLLK